MKYEICNSVDGITIIASIDLPKKLVETLSDANTEGHFLAGKIDKLVEHGISPGKRVYAIALKHLRA